jgi:hypothetical protein
MTKARQALRPGTSARSFYPRAPKAELLDGLSNVESVMRIRVADSLTRLRP